MKKFLSGSLLDAQRLGRWGILFGIASVVTACQGAESDETVVSAVVTANGLTSNGLTSNGLTSNGLTSNGLTSNGLTSNGLAGSTLAALRDKSATGDVTRMFFKYMVSCALPANHSVTYTWTDSAGALHTEVDPGAFSLAPNWETGGINETDEEWVSACLFARTNGLGVSVPISIRGNGPAALAASPQERMDYPYGEGAFWGNLFASTPYGRSCGRAAFRAGAPTSADPEEWPDLRQPGLRHHHLRRPLLSQQHGLQRPGVLPPRQQRRLGQQLQLFHEADGPEQPARHLDLAAPVAGWVEGPERSQLRSL